MLSVCTSKWSATDEELVQEFVCRSGAAPSDVLSLVGPQAIGLLAELWRRGFEDVRLSTASCSARAEPADILWLPHARAEALGAGRLGRHARALRDGGTILLQGDAPATRGRVATLRAMLAALGFDPIEQIVRSQGFCLSPGSLFEHRRGWRHEIWLTHQLAVCGRLPQLGTLRRFARHR